ncbi:hypothetical protein WG66_006126 [Moniliophthora roreri]|nr:hypothetical protein WG66_006126 [Moniliophthora roreri]
MNRWVSLKRVSEVAKSAMWKMVEAAPTFMILALMFRESSLADASPVYCSWRIRFIVTIPIPARTSLFRLSIHLLIP